MLFSQRNGFKKVKDSLQIESIDIETRNCLWSGLKLVYWDNLSVNYLNSEDNSDFKQLFSALWLSYFKQPIDTLEAFADRTINHLRKYFFSCNWYEVYDFVEFIPNHFTPNYYRRFTNNDFISYCNALLEREKSGYRFINNQISPITSSSEIEEIESAINNSFDPVSIHLNRSLELLSDRITPDYRNSIKESISAVESFCKIIADKPKATLGEAIKEVEKSFSIHSALKNAFNNLYGFTSDEHGIRHALMDTSDLKFDDAKFMLVSCSAFVNYLKSKMAK